MADVGPPSPVASDAIDSSGRRKHVSNTLVTACGGFVYTVAQALTIAVVFRTAGEQDAGRLLYALALTTPVALLAGLGLRDLLAAGSVRRITLTLGATLTAGNIVVVALLATLAGLLVRPSSGVLILAVLAGKLFETISFVAHADLERRRQFVYPALSTAVRGMLSPVCFGTMYAGWSMESAAVLLAVAQLLVAAVDIVIASERPPIVKRMRPTEHLQWARALLPYALSQVAVILLISGVRIEVGLIAGLDALATFGMISLALRALQLALNAIVRVAAPELGANALLATGRNVAVLKRVAAYTTAAGVVVSLGFVLFGPLVLEVLIGSQLEANWVLYACIGASSMALFFGAFASQAAAAHCAGWSMLGANALALTLGLGAGAGLLWLFGISGAGVGLLLGLVSRGVLMYVAVYRYRHKELGRVQPHIQEGRYPSPTRVWASGLPRSHRDTQ